MAEKGRNVGRMALQYHKMETIPSANALLKNRADKKYQSESVLTVFFCVTRKHECAVSDKRAA